MAQACIVKFGYHTSKNPKGGNIKQFKRMLLGVFAAAFVAVAWGDSAPPSFDIRELSDEQRRALINSLLPHQLDPWLEQFQGEDTIIFSVDTTRSNEEDTGTENTVGHYYCDLNVHYPHVGASSGTVKAKAYASCSLTQTGDPFPPSGGSGVGVTPVIVPGKVVGALAGTSLGGLRNLLENRLRRDLAAK